MIPLLFDPDDCRHEEREPPNAMQLVSKSRKEGRLALAFTVLLQELSQWIGIRGVTMEDERLSADLRLTTIWRTGFKDDGPATAIMEANKREPLLWWDALPEDVVIVPKSTLKMLADQACAAGEEQACIEMAQRMAVYSIENHAARARGEWEDARLQKRYGRRPDQIAGKE
jgi:hypothetical protein